MRWCQRRRLTRPIGAKNDNYFFDLLYAHYFVQLRGFGDCQFDGHDVEANNRLDRLRDHCDRILGSTRRHENYRRY